MANSVEKHREEEARNFLVSMNQLFLEGENSLLSVFTQEDKDSGKKDAFMQLYEEKIMGYLFPSWKITMHTSNINSEGKTIFIQEASDPSLTYDDMKKAQKLCANCQHIIEKEKPVHSCTMCMITRPELMWGTYCEKCHANGQVCRVHVGAEHEESKNGDGSVVPQILNRNLEVALHKIPASSCDCGNGICKPITDVKDKGDGILEIPGVGNISIKCNCEGDKCKYCDDVEKK